jgi:hypothetical protein
MRQALAEFWRQRQPDAAPERRVLMTALAVRLGAVATLAYGMLLGWPHLRSPGLALLLVLGLLVEAAAVAGWWLYRRRVDATYLALTVPVGIAALTASAALTDPRSGWPGYVVLTGPVFPYTVVLAITFGFAWRSAVAAGLTGALWGLVDLCAAVFVMGYPWTASLVVLPPYLLYPVAGSISAGLLRRGTAELDTAREVAVRQAAEIATEKERDRHAQALHDRVLQTMETLARAEVITDQRLRSRILQEAGWLRRFVETGELNQDEDLPAELAAATRAVSAGGTAVELNDSALRIIGPPRLAARTREALVEATYHTLAGVATAVGSVVVRAEPTGTGVRVTILALHGATTPQPHDVERIRSRLAEVGGQLTVEPLPYAEIWVPADVR